jgi:hypothetical protein
MWLVILIGLSIVIPLAIFGAKVLFWVLAFADFALLVGVSVYFTHFQWGWHMVFVILGAFAVVVVYYGVLRLPVVQYILPVAALGFISWVAVSLVNEIRVESFDLIWTIALIVVSAVALICARFYAVGELDLT